MKPVLAAHKPVFLDKPCAASLKDALEIFRLAKAANVPIFSSSFLRFAKDTQAVHNGSIGRVFYAETTSPLELEPHHPEMFLVWHPRGGIAVHGDGPGLRISSTRCADEWFD